ncbi:hypothetical protein JKP88DRAFT_346465 [Tribonema minus]|uniref:Uncharacterized protein n=1 Tax=Tribonema minus TaxID=303371 RepID=A0A835ZEU9_9STRA|nr:hypothetical protein JKP88DRAFT_346465 [Tribonema minus]
MRPLVPALLALCGAETIWLPVYDAAAGRVQLEQRVVIFGGKGEDYMQHPGAADQEDFLNDVWALHITNNGFIWSELDSGLRNAPGRRWKFSMSAYNDSSAFAIFGGDNEAGDAEYLGDLWSFETSSAFTIFGGDKEEGDAEYLGDLWSFCECALRVEAHTSSAFAIFGGDNKAGDVAYLGDLWSDKEGGDAEYLGDLWSFAPQQGVTLGGKSWQRLWATDTEHPPGQRRGQGMAVSSGGVVVLASGKNGEGELECDSKVFAFDLTEANATWATKTSLPAPCRWGQTMTRVITYPNTTTNSTGISGGTTADSAATSTTTSSSSSSSSAQPDGAAQKGAARALKASQKGEHPVHGTEKLVLFGGRRYQGSGYKYFNDLWAYDPVTDTWELLTPEVEENMHGVASEADALETYEQADDSETYEQVPRPRDHHGAVYVEELHSLFIHGGRWTDEMVPALDDIWSFNFKTRRWKQHAQVSTKRPSPRFGHGLTAWRGSAGDGSPGLALVGGEVINSSGHHDLLNDVWLYAIADSAWRKVGRSDCSPGATGIIEKPVVDLSVLLMGAASVLIAGLAFTVYKIVQGRKKARYVPIGNNEFRPLLYSSSGTGAPRCRRAPAALDRDPMLLGVLDAYRQQNSLEDLVDTLRRMPVE